MPRYSRSASCTFDLAHRTPCAAFDVALNEGEVLGLLGESGSGKIVGTGPAHTLVAQPQHEYTRSLLASVPTIHTDREKPLAMIAKDSS